MVFELIGKHVLDAVCTKIQEMNNRVAITIEDDDDKKYLLDELEKIMEMIQFNRISCNVQPID